MSEALVPVVPNPFYLGKGNFLSSKGKGVRNEVKGSFQGNLEALEGWRVGGNTIPVAGYELHYS
jgi:hypothetical protein